MDKILFINACIRPDSRTLELAETLLQTLNGHIQEVVLQEKQLPTLDLEGMQKRNQAAQAQDFSDPIFDAAKQFAAADIIVIAAPYWDLMFPAVVKTYLENITVSGITFRYGENGIPQGLCRAKRLIYVTTAGGPIFQNYGYEYIKALAQGFYGIPDVSLVRAEGLDIRGADPEAIMTRAKMEIFA